MVGCPSPQAGPRRLGLKPPARHPLGRPARDWRSLEGGAARTRSRRRGGGSGRAQRAGGPGPHSSSCRGGGWGPVWLRGPGGRRWARGGWGGVVRGGAGLGRKARGHVSVGGSGEGCAGGWVAQSGRSGGSRGGQSVKKAITSCSLMGLSSCRAGASRLRVWYKGGRAGGRTGGRAGGRAGGPAAESTPAVAQQPPPATGGAGICPRPAVHSLRAASAVCSTRAAASGAAKPARAASRAVPQAAATPGSIQPPWPCLGGGRAAGWMG